MVLLGRVVSQINFSTQLKEAEQLFERATPNVTFLGARVVTVAGKKGSVRIDTIEILLNKAARRRSAKDDLSMVERAAGLRILEKIESFRKKTTELARRANFFTQICIYIRECITSRSLSPLFNRVCKTDRPLERPGGAPISGPSFFTTPYYSGLCFQMMSLERYKREKETLPDRIRILELHSEDGKQHYAPLVFPADIFDRARQESL